MSNGVILKILVCVVLIFIIAIPVKRGFLNYSGSCFGNKKYLSDQEKIDSAVHWVLSIYPPAVKRYELEESKKVIVFERPKNPVHYASIKEFLALNPDCCYLTRSIAGGGGDITVLDKLFGSVSDYVRVKYKVRFRNDQNKNIVSYSELYIAVSNCGEIK